MADKHEAVRRLDFRTLTSVLGVSMESFKRDERKREWVGPCPVHGGKTNKGAFRYNDSGVYHCFSCECKGSGAIDLTMAVKQIGFQAACELLQPFVRVQVESPHSRQDLKRGGASKKPFDPAKLKYHKYFRSPHAWLEARGLSLETCERYGVGYYENPARKSIYNCSVMIPFKEFETGELAGYLSRNIGEVTADRPKYRMPAGFEKSKYLFGAWELRQKTLPLKVVFVVESPFSVCRFHQLGFDCVASYGWSLSESQIGLLRNLGRGVVLLPDSDKRDQLLQSRFDALLEYSWVKAPRLPDGCCDPETLLPDQIRALL